MKNTLRIIRAVPVLTPEEPAEKTRGTRHTIIAIANERYDPSLGLAFRMSDLFGVLIEDIFIREKQG